MSRGRIQLPGQFNNMAGPQAQAAMAQAAQAMAQREMAQRQAAGLLHQALYCQLIGAALAGYVGYPSPLSDEDIQTAHAGAMSIADRICACNGIRIQREAPNGQESSSGSSGEAPRPDGG